MRAMIAANGRDDRRLQDEAGLLAQARRETRERFGSYTDANADEALAWQEARIQELRREWL